jgi:hypothetical protein
MWLSNIRNNIKRGLTRDKGFIQRWPSNPKVVFYGPPNVFQEEITQRFAIDLGIPVVSMNQIIENVVE